MKQKLNLNFVWPPTLDADLGRAWICYSVHYWWCSIRINSSQCLKCLEKD